MSSNCNNFNFPRSLRRMRLSSESRSKTDAISDPGNNSSPFALSQFKCQVYLPSFMFVVTSWVSFLIKPEVVPGRMALLVTLFLVLINIFNSVRYLERVFRSCPIIYFLAESKLRFHRNLMLLICTWWFVSSLYLVSVNY